MKEKIKSNGSLLFAVLFTLLSLLSPLNAAAVFERSGIFYMTASDNPSLPFDITVYQKSQNDFYVFLPNSFDGESVKLKSNITIRTASGANAAVNRSDNSITFDAAGESTVIVNNMYYINVMQSSVPSLNVEINEGYSLDSIHYDKDVKIKGTASVNGAEDSKYNLSPSPVEIKTRGNTTFYYDKKPYQIKFDSKTDLFGMGKAKKWILLANYIDGTSVRNKVIFDLGEEMGIPYVVQSVFVDLYIDGDYKGVYQLCEKVEVGSSRVPLKDEAGVILEMDAANRNITDEIYFNTQTTNKPFVFKDYVTDFEETVDPAVIGKVNDIKASVESYINRIEEELYSDTSDWDVISSLIDVDSFAKFYLLTEFCEEVDATYSSTFFYMDGPSDVLHCGPLWDYDRCCGWNDDYDQDSRADFLKNIIDSTDEWRVDWFKMLFRHPEFNVRVNEIYDEYVRDIFDTEKVLDKIDSYQKMLMPSLKMNHVKWVVFHNRSYTADEIFSGTTEEYIKYTTDAMKNWITERNKYLTTAYGSYHPTLLYTTGFCGEKYTEYSGGCISAAPYLINELNMRLDESKIDGSIEYAYGEGGSLSPYAKEGTLLSSGDSGEAFRGISMRLTGNLENYYSIEYRVFQNGSWTSWKKDGALAGRLRGNESVYGISKIQARLILKSPIKEGCAVLMGEGEEVLFTLNEVVGNLVTLPIPSKNGYSFEGWYTSSDFSGEPVTEFVSEEGSVVFWAKFRKLFEPEPRKGDVNGDGQIDTRDILLMKKFIAGYIKENDIFIENADMNSDGKITAIDSMLLKSAVSS